MFELTVAAKYLIPRWRQLSTSIISLISVFVISTVVWLVLVFFSVSNGLEKVWIQKMTTLTAPVRVTPTEEYYRSYYYLVDSLSEGSNYSFKSLREKSLAERADPYDPSEDAQVPSHWPLPDRDSRGELKDLVKEVFQAADSIAGVQASEYEMAFGNLRLRLPRGQGEYATLNQAVYLGSFDQKNRQIMGSLIEPSGADVTHLAQLIEMTTPAQERSNRLKGLFSQVESIRGNLDPKGTVIAHQALPENEAFNVQVEPGRLLLTEKKGQRLVRIGGKTTVLVDGKEKDVSHLPVVLQSNEKLDATPLAASSLRSTHFQINPSVQGRKVSIQVPWDRFQIQNVHLKRTFSQAPQEVCWAHQVDDVCLLPYDPQWGEAVLLPKNFREAGVRWGDQGAIAYYAPTASAVQEQQIPVYVAGFYDYGIMPIGGKFLLTNPEVTSLIRGTYQQNDSSPTTGINIRFADLKQAEKIKMHLTKELQERGVSPYWHVETYSEYDFTRDFVQQLKSEKTLFSLIAGVIIIVACTSIISMLIILVNDKRVEIGILRAMGATSKSIALIFGTCGVMMGLVGSLIGTLLAVITLKNIDVLIGWIGALQGHQVFNAFYYGDTIPNELSGEALLFVFTATIMTSLVAGLVPAVKASLINASEILRSQ